MKIYWSESSWWICPLRGCWCCYWFSTLGSLSQGPQPTCSWIGRHKQVGRGIAVPLTMTFLLGSPMLFLRNPFGARCRADPQSSCGPLWLLYRNKTSARDNGRRVLMQKLAATDDSTSPRIHWKSSQNLLLKITLFCFLSGWILSLHLLTFKAWHVLDISIFSKEDL